MMFISESNLAAITGTSLSTTKGWSAKGIYPSYTDTNGVSGFDMNDLTDIPEIESMVNSQWDNEFNVVPLRDYTSIELFAGGGGLALGMEKAGFKHVLLNEFDTSACNTLRLNRPGWNIIEGDIRHIDFTPLRDKIDFLSGGFPCQAFSFAGKQGGFNDTRGTLFFELARAVKEIRPKVFMGENVKGLVSHDNGKTFNTIRNIISELGYTLVSPRVLKGIMYQVPQKRERIILIAIRNDIAKSVCFHWPSPYKRVSTLRDALFNGILYDCDVPDSIGAKYPPKKQKVLELVPEGGDWRDLPEEIAKEYMGGSWLLGGGKTGMARRLSLDEPSLTLTCSPCQKQTERCHPLETRPLTIREYARIQTFPDNWIFQGTMNDQYKQIGNAVPVNLAWAVGRSLIRLFNDIQRFTPSETADCSDAVKQIIHEQSKLIVVKDKNTQTSTIAEDCSKLDLFSLYEEYSDSFVTENSVNELEYPFVFPNNQLQDDRQALIALVKDDNIKDFENQSAKVYYTGKKFPASIDLKHIHYFIPYFSKKGIRDIYIVKRIRVGKYKEGQSQERKNDYRLIFEIQHIGKISEDFQKHSLKIWRTFSSIPANEVL